MAVAKKRRYDMTARRAAAEQTRVRIMEAAYRLLVAHSYDDVTMASVAAEAGVSLPSVVQHFHTKDGLVEAILEWWQPQEQALREVEDGDPLAAARKVCARYEDNGLAVLRMLAIEGRIAAVDRILAHGRAQHREWVERTWGSRLGSGAAREKRVMGLVAAYDLYTWSVLRRALDADATCEVMAELARGVLERGGKR